MPPSNNETAAAMSPRSDRMTPTSIAARTTPPAATAIRAARMNLRQLLILAKKLFNVLLEADDLLEGITIV
jgi:hypothetical protein